MSARTSPESTSPEGWPRSASDRALAQAEPARVGAVALRGVSTSLGVTVVIPGARDAAQAAGQPAVAGQPPLTERERAVVAGAMTS